MIGTKVRVVLEGYLVREGNVVVDASSTVALIEASDKRIVVDTGKPSVRASLTESLAGLGVAPDEVNIVVNTHLHIDHCGCNNLFGSAKYYAHASESPSVRTTRISGETSLAPGVSIVPTPGHTAGCVSVFVSAERRYAIAGDALPTKGNYDSHTPPSTNIDPRLALRSMDAISSWAEVVVPGHGGPFEVRGKK